MRSGCGARNEQRREREREGRPRHRQISRGERVGAHGADQRYPNRRRKGQGGDQREPAIDPGQGRSRTPGGAARGMWQQRLGESVAVQQEARDCRRDSQGNQDEPQLARERAQRDHLGGVPDRPVLEADPEAMEGEGLKLAEDLGGGRVQVRDQPRNPRKESGGRPEVREERRSPRLRMRPQEPQKLGTQREDGGVVGVDRCAGAGGVGHPPAGATIVHCGQHGERREHHQDDHQFVSPRLR